MSHDDRPDDDAADGAPDAPTRSLGSPAEAATRGLGGAKSVARRALPERVGRYRVGAILGRGGMGVVVRGHDDASGDDVALKFLDGVLAHDEGELLRVDREARLLAALRHPHVALVLGVEDDDGLPVLVLELVEGESLSEVLASGPLPVPRAVELALQIASAVEAAHAFGIVHRDLKPSNVKLAADGRAKVLDFGLACRVAAAAPRSLQSEAADLDPGGVSGSIGYMPPEQVRGASADPTADTWSLGVLLYEMLAGRAAFPGRTAGERLDATLRATPDFGALPADIPLPVRELVLRCLSSDPEDRPANAGAVAAALRPHAGTAAGGALAAPAAPPEALGPRLPRPATRFVGRQRELAAVRGLLAHSRLVTITGAGGSGKTRLALESGLSLESGAQGRPRSVTLVELAVLPENGDVDQAVASALGLADRPGAVLRDAIVASLADEDRVLVLDNCEHVLEAARSCCDALLRACPRLVLLATSRSALRCAEESVFALPALMVPAAGAPTDELARCESVVLFVERARAARRSFRLDDETAPLVGRCCRRLDGIPLAIELAAARLRSLPLQRLAEALDESFEIVSGGSPGALPRHQALHATIEWSHAALGDGERRAYRRLSAFAGPFTLPLAARVLDTSRAEAAELVSRLVESSLLEQRVGPERTTWRMLEPIRQHAAEKLDASGEARAARGTLLDAFVSLGHDLLPRLDGDDMARAVAELTELHANLVEAMRIAADDGRPDDGIELIADVATYWIARAHWREGRTLVERLIEDGRPWSKRSRAQGRVMSSQFSMMLGDSELARASLDLSLPDLREERERTGDEASLADALNTLSQVHWQMQDLVAARKHGEEALEIRRRLGNRDLIANSLNNIGLVARSAGDLATARERLDECLAIMRPLGNVHNLAVLLSNIAVVAQDQGDLQAARHYLEDALAFARTCGARRGELFAEANLGAVAFDQERLADCRVHARAAGAIAAEIGDRSGALTVLWTLARLAEAEGELERAATLQGANLSVREALGATRFVNQARWDALNDRVRASLGSERFDAAFASGRALTMDEALRKGVGSL